MERSKKCDEEYGEDSTTVVALLIRRSALANTYLVLAAEVERTTLRQMTLP
jgi:hypothetical protein